MVEDSNIALQEVQLNFRKAENIINTLKEIISRYRFSERFDLVWDSAVLAAKAAGIYEPTLPRKRKTPARLNGTGDHHFSETPKDHYCKISYEIVDAVLVGLNSRFEETETSKHLITVVDFIIGKSDVSHGKEFFRDDFEDYGRLFHRDLFLDQAKAKNVTLEDFQSALDFLKSVNEDISQSLTSIIPEFVKLMKIVLTMPVSTCTAERSFSCLRRLKTYFHSTMTQDRLNHLAVLCCHSDLLESIDLDVLLDEFISKNAIRMNTFALIH
ncbi:zinc finger MYM-type protein 1-like [Daphnia magna]|uniref:zinc finger MYM-type protein 1-like n=1 Tax=Daphnia magna TaxID=35525 RepID=UPI001E1BA793|nr:zinc finger MYM-type protein 1-like [Daphnia magna]